MCVLGDWPDLTHSARAPSRPAAHGQLAAHRALSAQESSLRVLRDRALAEVKRLEREEQDIKRSFGFAGVALEGDTDEEQERGQPKQQEPQQPQQAQQVPPPQQAQQQQGQ